MAALSRVPVEIEHDDQLAGRVDVAGGIAVLALVLSVIALTLGVIALWVAL